MTYAEKLRDPRWQRKRLEVLDRDQYTCRECKATDKPLHVHHVKYEKGDPWHIESAYLMTLCESCHERRGAVEKAIRNNLADWFLLHSAASLEAVAAQGLNISPRRA